MSKRILLALLLLSAIGLLFAVIVGSAQETAITSGPFSGVTCSDCHTCETPTITDPCLQACPRPRIGYKKVAPDTIIIDLLENLYVPVSFPHKMHMHLGKTDKDCGTCHHHTPPGHGYPVCQECHTIEPSVESPIQPTLKGAYHQNCMACHMEWSHDKKCVVCHAKKGEEVAVVRHYPGVEEPMKMVWPSEEFDKGTKVTFFHKNHVELYGFACTKCHQGESCRNCHDKGEPRYKFARDADAFHDMCNQCHGKRSCEWCHRTEEIAAFTHAAWPLNRYHKPLSCAKCHKTKGKFKGLSRRCEACHSDWSTANFNHAKITGVELDEIHLEMDCGDCHMDRNFARKPTCDACHDDGRSYPASKPGP